MLMILRVESCCVQRNCLLRLRLGMTDDTGPLQCAPRSWILSRMPFNCISQCTIESFVSRSQSCGSRRVAFQHAFNSPPTCFAVSLMSPLKNSKVPVKRATETTIVQSLLCEDRSSLLCSPSRERGTISAGFSIPALSLPSRDHGTFRIPSTLSASHLSDSGILLTFGACLDRQPLAR